ncbi:unnamed protein product [Caenorhabditis auriculariae]|uniref:Uncharacterized protein n=1 Tax=Caenorhabditis auriculariae TaxID=2777116 RepID=A0A8S1H7R2_9PELO|nr:unnamed protein product [Caenorhabditis auriculariae]
MDQSFFDDGGEGNDEYLEDSEKDEGSVESKKEQAVSDAKTNNQETSSSSENFPKSASEGNLKEADSLKSFKNLCPKCGENSELHKFKRSTIKPKGRSQLVWIYRLKCGSRKCAEFFGPFYRFENAVPIEVDEVGRSLHIINSAPPTPITEKALPEKDKTPPQPFIFTIKSSSGLKVTVHNRLPSESSPDAANTATNTSSDNTNNLDDELEETAENVSFEEVSVEEKVVREVATVKRKRRRGRLVPKRRIKKGKQESQKTLDNVTTEDPVVNKELVPENDASGEVVEEEKRIPEEKQEDETPSARMSTRKNPAALLDFPEAVLPSTPKRLAGRPKKNASPSVASYNPEEATRRFHLSLGTQTDRLLDPMTEVLQQLVDEETPPSTTLECDVKEIPSFIARRLFAVTKLLESKQNENERMCEELFRMKSAWPELCKVVGSVKAQCSVELNRMTNDMDMIRGEFQRHQNELLTISQTISSRIANERRSMQAKYEGLELLKNRAEATTQLRDAELSYERRRVEYFQRQMDKYEQISNKSRESADEVKKKLQDKLFLAKKGRCTHCQVAEKNRGLLIEEVADKTMMLNQALQKRDEYERRAQDAEQNMQAMRGEFDKLRYEAKVWKASHEEGMATVSKLRKDLQSLQTTYFNLKNSLKNNVNIPPMESPHEKLTEPETNGVTEPAPKVTVQQPIQNQVPKEPEVKEKEKEKVLAEKDSLPKLPTPPVDGNCDVDSPFASWIPKKKPVVKPPVQPPPAPKPQAPAPVEKLQPKPQTNQVASSSSPSITSTISTTSSASKPSTSTSKAPEKPISTPSVTPNLQNTRKRKALLEIGDATPNVKKIAGPNGTVKTPAVVDKSDDSKLPPTSETPKTSTKNDKKEDSKDEEEEEEVEFDEEEAPCTPVDNDSAAVKSEEKKNETTKEKAPQKNPDRIQEAQPTRHPSGHKTSFFGRYDRERTPPSVGPPRRPLLMHPADEWSLPPAAQPVGPFPPRQPLLRPPSPEFFRNPPRPRSNNPLEPPPFARHIRPASPHRGIHGHMEPMIRDPPPVGGFFNRDPAPPPRVTSWRGAEGDMFAPPRREPLIGPPPMLRRDEGPGRFEEKPWNDRPKSPGRRFADDWTPREGDAWGSSSPPRQGPLDSAWRNREPMPPPMRQEPRPPPMMRAPPAMQATSLGARRWDEIWGNPRPGPSQPPPVRRSTFWDSF